MVEIQHASRKSVLLLAIKAKGRSEDERELSSKANNNIKANWKGSITHARFNQGTHMPAILILIENLEGSSRPMRILKVGTSF